LIQLWRFKAIVDDVKLTGLLAAILESRQASGLMMMLREEEASMAKPSSEDLVHLLEDLIEESDLQSAVDLILGSESGDQLLLVQRTKRRLLAKLIQRLSDAERSELSKELIVDAPWPRLWIHLRTQYPGRSRGAQLCRRKLGLPRKLRALRPICEERP
jgi:hypothetical protein